MAPSTPVYSRAEILNTFHISDSTFVLDDKDCTLFSLTQNECTILPGEKGSPASVICLPFKRMFKRCLLNSPKQAVQLADGIYGQKSKNRFRQDTEAQKYVIIEITSAETNSVAKLRAQYGELLESFLKAEKELRRQYEHEYPFRSG
ncbi:hypothetical protein BABINDRAFT_163621 [Babjeviella inositovora NRRL Y-12698]|uniref:Uncharacterized protein n=1 Tax=Babjeviella inositovora NRRL Y-12698 TaxID=984486 RepID=A0A1E3QI44_9ASCO|nr:uncharacterized protein BABINDRAFT_163621 [Babjeviella inositovora NRRL Y-12698]ODQ77366.1 hypothetical protein BABINDRAFT_163621 [Babjeviella inositovora NRRL Y-12698]